MSGYVSTWHELVCPNCEAHNFVDAGDLNDMTGFDPEGCKCWNCSHCFDFEGEPADPDMCDEGENMKSRFNRDYKE